MGEDDDEDEESQSNKARPQRCRTPASTRSLIELRLRFNDKFIDSINTNEKVWEAIAMGMKELVKSGELPKSDERSWSGYNVKFTKDKGGEVVCCLQSSLHFASGARSAVGHHLKILFGLHLPGCAGVSLALITLPSPSILRVWCVVCSVFPSLTPTHLHPTPPFVRQRTYDRPCTDTFWLLGFQVA
eukprot:scaffold133432_cov32-Tisochrysis_lutea.AAC.1